MEEFPQIFVVKAPMMGTREPNIMDKHKKAVSLGMQFTIIFESHAQCPNANWKALKSYLFFYHFLLFHLAFTKWLISRLFQFLSWESMRDAHGRCTDLLVSLWKLVEMQDLTTFSSLTTELIVFATSTIPYVIFSFF